MAVNGFKTIGGEGEISPSGVRRDKAARSPWVKISLGYRFSRKQP